MDNLRHLPARDDVFSEASEWLSKLDRGLVREEEAELKDWLARTPENQHTLLKMAGLWDRMDTLNRLSQIFPRKARRKPASPWKNFSVAAMLLLALGISAWQIQSMFQPIAPESTLAEVAVSVPNFYETAVGEHSTVNLQDGTRVTLNTNTRATVNFTTERRLIYLQRGEIHVEVTPDKDRPLSVIAGDKIVQAVGTAFSITISDDDRMELLVTHGEVIVGQQSHGKIASAAPQQMPADYVSVAAGQAILPTTSATQISTVDEIDMEAKLAWREGNLIFRGEPLSEAVLEVSRYTDIRFTFSDNSAKQVRVAGRFKVGDIDTLLAALQQNFDITHERVDASTIVIGRVN